MNGQYNLDGLLGNDVAGDVVQNAKTNKVFFVDLKDVKPNPLNYFKSTDERVVSLADDIALFGLLIAGVGYEFDDGKYCLLAGERRYRALCKLFEEGKSYSYHGKDITGKFPITLISSDELDTKSYMRLLITEGNNQRDLTDEEKEEMVISTLDDLNELETLGYSVWQEGKRTYETIAEKTGLSGNYVKNLLAKKGMTRTRTLSEEKKEDTTKSKDVSEEEKQLKKIIRAFDKAIKEVSTAKELIGGGIDDDSYQKIITDASALSESLNTLLNIYAK